MPQIWVRGAEITFLEEGHASPTRPLRMSSQMLSIMSSSEGIGKLMVNLPPWLFTGSSQAGWIPGLRWNWSTFAEEHQTAHRDVVEPFVLVDLEPLLGRGRGVFEETGRLVVGGLLPHVGEVEQALNLHNHIHVAHVIAVALLPLAVVLLPQVPLTLEFTSSMVCSFLIILGYHILKLSRMTFIEEKGEKSLII